MQSPPLLEAREVVCAYTRGGVTVKAVAGVSLAIRAGTCVLVRGASGSGKTTLLNLLSGLQPATTGSVHFSGRDLAGWSAGRLNTWRRQSVALIFQSLGLLPELTALENVDVGLRVAGASPRRARQQAQEALRSVGLAERAGHRIQELSGGEQQRVAVARALARSPRLLLADEPTGELDRRTGTLVFGLLADLVADHGATVVLASHDPAATGFADRCITLQDGRVVEDTP